MKTYKKKLTRITSKRAYDYMPQESNELTVLNERAKQLAQIEMIKENDIENNLFIKFKLGANEFYGIPYQYAKEVIQHFKLSPIPCGLNFFCGVINWRGVLTTIVDLKKLLGMKSTGDQLDQHIIILQAKNYIIGLLVDSIVGSCAYIPSLISPVKEERINNMIMGLHEGTTAILDIDLLINHIKKGVQ